MSYSRVFQSMFGMSEIICTHPKRSWGPPSFLYSGYQVSLARLTLPGRGVDYPSPSSADVDERAELYLYSPSEFSWPVLGCSFLCKCSMIPSINRNLLYSFCKIFRPICWSGVDNVTTCLCDTRQQDNENNVYDNKYHNFRVASIGNPSTVNL